MTKEVFDYLGDDISLLEEKIKEFVIGYGYQNAKEIRFDESEIVKEGREETYIMTFEIKTSLYKDPIIVVKYQKKIHWFDIEIW